MLLWRIVLKEYRIVFERVSDWFGKRGFWKTKRVDHPHLVYKITEDGENPRHDYMYIHSETLCNIAAKPRSQGCGAANQMAQLLRQRLEKGPTCEVKITTRNIILPALGRDRLGGTGLWGSVESNWWEGVKCTPGCMYGLADEEDCGLWVKYQ
jgi:hypothetical protein